jgi:hypothetical protein
MDFLASQGVNALCRMSRDAGLADVFQSGLVPAVVAVVLQEGLVIGMDDGNIAAVIKVSNVHY